MIKAIVVVAAILLAIQYAPWIFGVLIVGVVLRPVFLSTFRSILASVSGARQPEIEGSDPKDYKHRGDVVEYEGTVCQVGTIFFLILGMISGLVGCLFAKAAWPLLIGLLCSVIFWTTTFALFG